MKEIIQTRQNRYDNWWCNATLFGNDYSFEGKTIEEAREQMIGLITRNGKNHNDYTWGEPVVYIHEPKKPKQYIQRIKLDHL